MMSQFNISRFNGNTEFTSVVARVRVLESLLITRQKFQRMIQKDTWTGVLDELRGTDYYDALVDVRSAGELEDKIYQFMHTRRTRIRKLVRHNRIIQVIFLDEYLRQVLPVIKKHFETSGNESQDHIKKELIDEIKKIDTLTASDEKKSFMKYLDVIITDFLENRNFYRIDLLFSKFYLSRIHQAITDTHSEFLKNFFMHRINLTNLLHVLRLKSWISPDEVDLSLFFLIQGFNAHFFTRLLKATDEKFVSLLKYTPYYPTLENGIKLYVEKKELWLLEKLCDDYLTNFCKMTNYTPFGIEPVIAYMWFSYQEMKNLHLILTTKFIRLPKEVISQRLRKTYA